MNILEQITDENFIKEQFIKGRILDDTKDYGRTQFVDEIYTLLQENKQLKDNWNKLKEYCKENTLCYEVGDDENTKLIGSRIHGLNVLDKMQEIEGNDSNE